MSMPRLSIATSLAPCVCSEFRLLAKQKHIPVCDTPSKIWMAIAGQQFDFVRHVTHDSRASWRLKGEKEKHVTACRCGCVEISERGVEARLGPYGLSSEWTRSHGKRRVSAWTYSVRR